VTKEEGTLKQQNNSVDRNICKSMVTAMSNLKKEQAHQVASSHCLPIAHPKNSKLIKLPHHIAFTPWPVARSCTTIVHAEQYSCLLLLGWLEQVAQSWPPLSTHMTELLCMDL
jgi:hypothetical protein